MRRHLPDERQSVTHKFAITTSGINGETFKGYVTVGLFEDGAPGELFVKMDKQGSLLSGFVDAWAISFSMLLQNEVPLAALCGKFKGTAFEPSGRTDNKAIPVARSPIDYIARWLEIKFLGVAPHIGVDG